MKIYKKTFKKIYNFFEKCLTYERKSDKIDLLRKNIIFSLDMSFIYV